MLGEGRSAILARLQCAALAGVDSHRRGHHLRDLLGGDRRLTTWPLLVGQPIESVLDEPRPPLARRRRRAAQP